MKRDAQRPRATVFALCFATLACGQSKNPTLPVSAGGAAGDGAGGAGAAMGQAGAAMGGASGGRGGMGGAGGSPEAGSGGASSRAPSGLLCELLQHPERTRITDSKPELGFIAGSARQSARQILVASSEALLAQDNGDVWDSGKTSSEASIDIEYEGAPLQAAATYFWKVRTWDASGVASPWSASQAFTMAAALDQYSTPRLPVVETPVAPKQLTTVADGSVFADFGRHAFGWLELELEVETPTPITVRLGERANGTSINSMPGGTVRYASVQMTLQPGVSKHRVHTPKDTRNTSGAAILLPEELGVVMPFRYAEVVGAPVALQPSMLRQVAVHYPYDEAASAFVSSDDNLNQVWTLSKYSMVAPTFAGVYIDGDRERIPYEGDAYIQQLGHYSVDRDFALARYSHEYLLAYPTWPTEWKQHSVLMAWADWMYTGNTESLAQAYDTLVAEKTMEQHVGADGLIDSGSLEDLVDWPEGERDGHVLTAVNTVVNAFFCRNLQQMAEIATALGKASEAERYTAMAQKAIASLNEKLIDPNTGVYVDGVGTTHSSLHSNMFPLAFGLVPPERQAQVTAFVKSRGMACSVYGAQYLLEALYLAGEAQAALDLMVDESDRSWMNMVRAGATIALEAWDAKYKPNLDWNHAWGGAPANIVPRFLLGVQPLTPGFGVAQIRPQPASLAQVEGTVPTIRGPIRVAWNHPPGGAPSLEFELPGNMQAEVEVPGALLAACEPWLDGAPAALVTRGTGKWVEGVGSGVHRMTCP